VDETGSGLSLITGFDNGSVEFSCFTARELVNDQFLLPYLYHKIIFLVQILAKKML
jgi:hypothetical protein